MLPSSKSQSQSGSNNYPQSQLVERLNLTNFKSSFCQFKSQHNHKNCPYFHNDKDRKRIGDFYTEELCPWINQNLHCVNGESCTKSHNRVEQLFREEKYKKKFCSYYPKCLNMCEYGPYCCFAHSEKDITIKLIHNYIYDNDFYIFHFKTIWCPFNLAIHDKSLCVYAHNWQDFRRSPSQFEYNPLPCPNWDSNKFIVDYNEGCGAGMNCKFCHGWKEQEYHPMTYRTTMCTMLASCKRKRDCPDFHIETERRIISHYASEGITKIVPMNRIVARTYKKKSVDDFYRSITYDSTSIDGTNENQTVINGKKLLFSGFDSKE